MADSYLTPEEQTLRQDAMRLTRRNDTILRVIARLEEALEENAILRSETDSRVQQLTRALESVDRQVPDAIGTEPCSISSRALYKVRAALYGNGFPRPEASATEHSEHLEKEE